jgi:hypothetical protein
MNSSQNSSLSEISDAFGFNSLVNPSDLGTAPSSNESQEPLGLNPRTYAEVNEWYNQIEQQISKTQQINQENQNKNNRINLKSMQAVFFRNRGSSSNLQNNFIEHSDHTPRATPNIGGDSNKQGNTP